MLSTLLSRDIPPPIAVEDDAGVTRLRDAWTELCGERDRLTVEERRLMDLCDPPPSHSGAPAPIALPEEVYEAQSTLPSIRSQRQLAASKAQRIERDLEKARERARRALDDARASLRAPLIKKVFEKFAEAVAATEVLIAFDDETRLMGGSASALPCPGLARNVYEFQRALAEKDGLL